MTKTFLTQYHIPIDLDSFIELFWESRDFFESFLSMQLEDLSVQVGPWEIIENNNNHTSSAQIQSISKQRQIRSYHPSRVSFPGLPSHAEVSSPLQFHSEFICPDF